MEKWEVLFLSMRVCSKQLLFENFSFPFHGSRDIQCANPY